MTTLLRALPMENLLARLSAELVKYWGLSEREEGLRDLLLEIERRGVSVEGVPGELLRFDLNRQARLSSCGSKLEIVSAGIDTSNVIPYDRNIGKDIGLGVLVSSLPGNGRG